MLLRFRNLRRVILLISLLVAVDLLALGIRHGLKAQHKRKREAAYQTALLSYMKVLKPGMTRKEVQDYLRARNVDSVQIC
jgi:Na+-transporting NADH:ubiquinone oxidoreductase subunit NqrC